MKKLAFSTTLLLVTLLLPACINQPVNRIGDAPPQTVARVDLQRYQGLWYEIARFPNQFETDCDGVTAEYALREDGLISVTNTCVKAGVKDVAIGRARSVDQITNAKLKVKFAPAWVPFAEGDYWVLYLDETYQTALVGSPDGKYLWILARTPEVSPEKLAEVKATATAQGYNVSALYMTKH